MQHFAEVQLTTVTKDSSDSKDHLDHGALREGSIDGKTLTAELGSSCFEPRMPLNSNPEPYLDVFREVYPEG